MQIEKKILASNGKSVHTIRFDTKTGFTCTCQSFRIRKEECKHIKEGRVNWFKNSDRIVG